MSMQIQRGLVKYKDRSDIICTYGVSATGIQYYFLDEAKLANGNIIVTTTLLEAVDPVAIASHIGVIDEDGNVVIQCVNKSIKPISSDILLVEKAQPTSQNVLDSIKLKDDPNSATKLVTTPAAIKDNINKVMNSSGRFVFNDQFSEASIYDIDGNNLVDNELYSFIGVDDKKIYFSKNTIDSEVVEYSLTNGDDNDKNEPPKLNVETTDITKDVIEKALNEEEQTEEEQTEEYVETDNTKENNLEEIDSASDNNVDETVESSQEDTIEEESSKEYSEEDNTIEDAISKVEEYEEDSVIPEVEDTIEEKKTDIDVDSSSDEEEIQENVEETLDMNVDEKTDKTEDISDDLEEIQDSSSVIEEDNDDETDGGESKEINYQENDYEEEEFDNPVYVEDSYDYGYDSDDSYNNLVESYNYSSSSSLPQKNIFDDVTVTISNLVELNRNLQSMVDNYEIKLAKCDASRKKLVELSKSQAREISSLNARIARLEADKEMLEAKVNALTPSANGDLVRAMADAHNILGQTQRTLRRNKNNY